MVIAVVPILPAFPAICHLAEVLTILRSRAHLQRTHLGKQREGRQLISQCFAQAQQWIDEINEKAPQLRMALYHGPNRARDFPPALLASHDVVITTYALMASEYNAAPQGALYRVRWHRC